MQKSNTQTKSNEKFPLNLVFVFYSPTSPSFSSRDPTYQQNSKPQRLHFSHIPCEIAVKLQNLLSPPPPTNSSISRPFPEIQQFSETLY